MADERVKGSRVASARLNEAQRRAVEHQGCPLIVLAGPGTGKTRVIVHRVADLIERRGVLPEHVLVMTFTVKAARELKTRLAELVDPARAERINAHTLHGFGLRLLRRFGDVLALPPISGSLYGGEPIEDGDGARRARRCSLIDSAQAARLLQRLILDHDLFAPERAGGVDAVAQKALGYFELFDNHALAPEATTAIAAEWAEAIHRGQNPAGDSIEGAELEAEQSRQRQFAGMAELHGRYVASRRRRGLLSFGDLQMLPIELLRGSAGVASIVRDEYRHVIVDEFQDVNQANIELLRLLAPPKNCRGESRASGQELVVVGDDDQAIYGFRGADDRAFWRFDSIWTESRRIALTENYRSRPRIIAAGNSIIERAEARFEPGKVIEFPKGEPADPPGVVECINLREDMVDGEVIAAMIRADVASRADVPAADGQGARWSRYAVIVRSGTDAERVREALWLERIPAVHDRSTDATENEGVRSIMAWMRLIVSPREAWCARALLSGVPFHVGVEAIGQWERNYRAALSRWRAADSGGLEGSHDDPGGFVAWLARRDGDDPVVRRFAELHERLARAAAEMRAAAALHVIVRETGIIHADLPDDRTRADRIEAVVALLRFAQERQSRLPAPGGIREFLGYFDDLSAGDRKLDRRDESDRIDDGGNGDGDPEQRADAVRLITAHGSKGLEFDTVFVPRVHPLQGYGKVRSSDGPQLPASFAAEIGPTLEGKDRVRAEERRVFYVACTRAENRLVLLAKRNKTRSKTTNFFEEIVHDAGLARSGVVRERDQEDVLREASRVSSAVRPPVSGAASFRGDERRREIIGRARTDLRLEAAGALSRLDSPDAGADQLEHAMSELERVARRLAAIAAIDAERSLPSICDAGDPYINTLRESVRADAARPVTTDPGRAGKVVLRAPVAPLRLSYTMIEDYRRCPRCWYLKHQLGLQEAAATQQVLGQVLHRSLERFYAEYRKADADGLPLPALGSLEAIARREYFAQVDAASEVDSAELDQLLQQLRLFFSRLHEPEAQILELEKRIVFKYATGADPSVEHTFEAKIDRVDQIVLPDGTAGYRIVDYKSGSPRKDLVEPRTDDLQLGTYVMAWRAHIESDVEGVAEYWLTATGQRGSCAFGEMELDKVRETIDEAIAGILRGRFEAGKDCKGGCDILGP